MLSNPITIKVSNISALAGRHPYRNVKDAIAVQILDSSEYRNSFIELMTDYFNKQDNAKNDKKDNDFNETVRLHYRNFMLHKVSNSVYGNLVNRLKDRFNQSQKPEDVPDNMIYEAIDYIVSQFDLENIDDKNSLVVNRPFKQEIFERIAHIKNTLYGTLHEKHTLLKLHQEYPEQFPNIDGTNELFKKVYFAGDNSFTLQGKIDAYTIVEEQRYIIEVKNRINKFSENKYDLDQLAFYVDIIEKTAGGYLVQEYNNEVKYKFLSLADIKSRVDKIINSEKLIAAIDAITKFHYHLKISKDFKNAVEVMNYIFLSGKI